MPDTAVKSRERNHSSQTGSFEATFSVSPDSANKTVQLSKLSGSPDITIDSGTGDISIQWQSTAAEAMLRFELTQEATVEIEGVSLGIFRGMLLGIELPITARCQIPSASDCCWVLVIERKTWQKGLFPSYSMNIHFDGWAHDPKIYNLGPPGTGPSGSR